MFSFKTSKIGRLINQNIIKIIVGVIVVILVIVVIQLLNENAKNDRKKVANTTNVIVDSSSDTIVSGGDVKEETNVKNKSIMESFIEYCNAQKIEEAYNLLSQACKETLYPTIEDFKNMYYLNVFTSGKSYDVQSWINDTDKYTYKVRLVEDMLATGKYDNSKVIEDYFTIVNEGTEEKLSINSYVCKEEINVSKEVNNNKITIVQKQVYMDYEIYTIEVENNSNYDVLLDSKETFKNTYLLGENGVKYSSYIDEVITEDLIIKAGEKKTIEIKFNKMYNPSIRIESIVFADIIQDYEIYTVLNDKNEYDGRLKLNIEI